MIQQIDKLSPYAIPGVIERGKTRLFELNEKHPALLQIANTVDIPVYELFAKGRKKPVIIYRQVARYILHKCEGYSQQKVARLMNCDHSTIIYSCNEVINNIEIYFTVKKEFSKVYDLMGVIESWNGVDVAKEILIDRGVKVNW